MKKKRVCRFAVGLLPMPRTEFFLSPEKLHSRKALHCWIATNTKNKVLTINWHEIGWMVEIQRALTWTNYIWFILFSILFWLSLPRLGEKYFARKEENRTVGFTWPSMSQGCVLRVIDCKWRGLWHEYQYDPHAVALFILMFSNTLCISCMGRYYCEWTLRSQYCRYIT